jgi:hypothetical protein
LRTFDISTLYDLSYGGEYQVEAYGAVSLAAKDSKTLSGDIAEFDSNVVTLSVDTRQGPAKLYLPGQEKELVACDPDSARVVLKVFEKVIPLAKGASSTLEKGADSLMEKYFGTKSVEDRLTILTRFRDVLRTAETIISGNSSTRYFCHETRELAPELGDDGCGDE